MLDATPAADPEVEASAAIIMDNKADFYTPPMAAESLSEKVPLPTVKRFNRKLIAGASIVGVLVVVVAFSVGLQKPKKRLAAAPDSAAHSPAPGAAISALPGTYKEYGDQTAQAQSGEAKAIPVLGEPRPGEAGAFASTGNGRALTPLQQYQQQRALDQLKAEDQARASAVSFSGGGAGSGSSLAVPVVSADSTSGLTDRLLDVAQRGLGARASNAAATTDDENRQEEKTSFLAQSRDSEFQLHHGLERTSSPFTLMAGAVVPCVLTQGINSDLPGEVGCMVSQNVYDTVTGTHLLLPQGTRALGTYDSRIAYGQSRVLVVWTRLVRPDGSALSLEGMPGADLSGYAGLTGHVNNHMLRLASGVVLGSIIGAGAQIATGANSQNPNFSELAVQGAAENANEVGQQITRKNLQIQPTIEIAPGSRINIFTTKDIQLPPYNG